MLRYASSVHGFSMPSFSGSNTTRFSLSSYLPIDSFELIEDPVEILRSQVLVEDVVDHHHRGAGACRKAFLLLLEEDAHVGRALAELDAELLLGVRHDLLCATQHA